MMKQRKILYGGDYNPEQWLDSPDILECDIKYMKAAGINVVTVGMFAWSVLEPEEGKYEFAWLKRIVDNLYQNGISVIMGTPSGARPKWLADAYPEVLRVRDDGVRFLFGRRHNHCYTSPVYREKVGSINKALAECFHTHPAVIMWHVSNEYEGKPSCHCSLCKAAFQKWLKGRYETIEKLNAKWCTTFWSHRYQSFEQVEPPSSVGEQELHALTLDWKRFVTEQMADFAENEIRALKEGGISQPVTTNLMYDYQCLNYDRLSQCFDLVSWDSYPVWHRGSDILTARDNGMQHDFMRSLKHQPYLLMESSPSGTNWQGVSKLKKPGLLRAAGLQALAHGSDSILYFQIRQSRGASEKFHGAVIDHYGGMDTRVFEEVAAIGKELQNLGEIAGSRVRADVALIYDIENLWALEEAQGPRNDGMYYHETVMKMYNAIKKLGVNVDVLSAARDISSYKLLAVPMLYMFREGIGDRLKEFVQKGGSILLTYWSGVVDENDRCFLGKTPYGLTDMLGLRRKEIDGLYDEEINVLVPEEKEKEPFREAEMPEGKMQERYVCRNLCEILDVWNARTLMVYEKDFYRGTPAVTESHYDQGVVYYIAADGEQRVYDHLLEKLAGTAGITPIVSGKIPESVEVCSRESEGTEYVFIQNFHHEAVEIKAMELDGCVLLGERKEVLNPFETLILKRGIAGE